MEEIRFDPEDPARRLRVALGTRVLLGGASMLFGVLGRTGSRGAVHRAERVWAAAAARWLRLRLDLEGMEHVDRRERYVVVSLHEGLADVVALLHLPLRLRFLVRDELFEWPALGRYLRATGQVRVEERPTRGSLRRLRREVEEVFDSGDSLAVFAQGSILGVEVGFQAGAFRLARRFGRPVLPVVLTGSHLVWEHPFSPVVRLGGRISMRVLPPLPPEALDPATVRDLERRMKGLALSESTAPARRFLPERDGWWDEYRYRIDPDFPELAERVERRRARLREV